MKSPWTLVVNYLDCVYASNGKDCAGRSVDIRVLAGIAGRLFVRNYSPGKSLLEYHQEILDEIIDKYNYDAIVSILFFFISEKELKHNDELLRELFPMVFESKA